MATNYVAKSNEDGTVDLYEAVPAMGIDFQPTQVLVLDDSNVIVSDLQAKLADAQAALEDLSEKIKAVNALVTPAESTEA